MFYVYLLYSQKSKKWYIGSTNNLRKRFEQHNSFQVRSTKFGVPWTLRYYEAFDSESSARMREKSLKNHGKGLHELKKRIDSKI